MDQTIPQGGWWSRNWKWVVPVGCLSLLMTCGCCVGGSLFVAFNAAKGTKAYQESVAKAKADPDVQEALGTPVETGWMVEYQVQGSPERARIRARIPLKGPKGEGSLHVLATQKGEELRFDRLDVVVGTRVIHLPGTAMPQGDAAPPEDDETDLQPSPEEGVPGEESPAEITIEPRTDRPGSDYRDNETTDADAEKCALDCSLDVKCKAYTFVKPTKTKQGRCRLKSRIPDKVAGDCCVSGVKK